MKIRQISIPSVGNAITNPSNSIFNNTFILGVIFGCIIAAIVTMIIWPKTKATQDSKS